MYRFFHELMVLMIGVMKVCSSWARIIAMRWRCRFGALLRNNYPLVMTMQASEKMTFVTLVLLSKLASA
jgi:hypothetical protein